MAMRARALDNDRARIYDVIGWDYNIQSFTSWGSGLSIVMIIHGGVVPRTHVR